ncbi:phage baseplate assembly protein V [uncultured Algibacter sp.]|uniref:type VI secretion system Vgr family protein n=1 Tax=uncultured Algibacter sp. TaxID=298659 RepID=UPI00321633B4
MALQSVTNIFIGGNEITSFKVLEIHQSIDAHHILELVCRMDVLEDLSAELGASSKNYLGETITVETTSLDAFSGYKSLQFKGLVTQVKTVKGHEISSGDMVVIKACSPTFLADDGPHYASHNDASLSEILDKTFRGYDTSKLELSINPSNNSPLHYSVQHNESAYNYASRLAAQYGEWFYYNGTQLVFGKPDTEALDLSYGVDLKEYNLSLMPQSHNYKYYANDYLLDEVHEKDAKDITSGANGYNGFVANKANAIFSKETKVWHNLYNDPQAKQRFDSSVELQKKAIEIKQVQITGISDNPGVKLGSIIKIEGGSYRVTNIIHTNNENGDYQNRFEGVTAEFDAYPNTNIEAFPRSETQTAIVMENADPDGMGRIKVQFPWQKIDGGMTPWIRMVTPHGGSEKGFHFIPETGEEVLVGFEGGNAEHPFMMGSLYNGNGKPESWKTEKNDIKAIRTRSGHTISLSDEDGKESITISDKNTNIIHFDTVEKTLTISSEEKLFLRSKYIAMYGDNIELHSNSAKIISENEAVMQTGNSNVAVLPDGIVVDSAKVDINGKTEANIVAGKLTTNSKGDTLISGAVVKLNS